MAETTSSAAYKLICSAGAITGPISQMAMASMSTPKKLRTAFIQAPALGSKAPAEAPISSSGTPMPMESANRAIPPNSTSWVWPIYSSAPASGAATQGLMISADSAPMAKTPTNRPPWMRLVMLTMPLSSPLGSCSS
ncbi:hypothetical protein GALL_340580 [mine drainage metagenome]|uniref:Uncharacterized protein n=1 Tax=mine drainage metagenome TaxID=410659 RepID=A0A1J5QLC0_9ZZZZ